VRISVNPWLNYLFLKLAKNLYNLDFSHTLSEQLKQKLEELAKEQDETVSDLVRDILEIAVTEGGESDSPAF